MNCLYITLFFNIVAGIVQTFTKSWNQLLNPESQKSAACTLKHLMTSFSTSSSSSKFFPATCFFRWRNNWKSLDYYKQQQFVYEFPLDVHLLRWEIVWRNAPQIWRDFGSALPFLNTSHSNKAGSTTVKRTWLTGKGSRSTPVLP